MEHKRIEYLDILKGIGILFVILGHTYMGGFIGTFIFSFHMPLFFLISGYCFKNIEFKELIRKNIKGLIVPYVFTCLLVIVWSCINLVVFENNKSLSIEIWKLLLASIYGSGSGNIIGYTFGISSIGAVWFLLALFNCKIFLWAILKIKKHYMQVFVIVIMSIVGFTTSKYVWLPFDISASMVIIVFVYLGYIIKEFNILEKDVTIFLKIVMLLIWIFCIKFGGMSLVRNYYKLGVIDMFGAICGTYYFMMLAKFISERTTYLKKGLLYLGKRTITILCFHLLEFNCMPWGKILALLGIDKFATMAVLIMRYIWAIIWTYIIEHIVFLKKIYYGTSSGIK